MEFLVPHASDAVCKHATMCNFLGGSRPVEIRHLRLPLLHMAHTTTCISLPHTWHILLPASPSPTHGTYYYLHFPPLHMAHITTCVSPSPTHGTYYYLCLPPLNMAYTTTCVSLPYTWHILLIASPSPVHGTYYYLHLPPPHMAHTSTCISLPPLNMTHTTNHVVLVMGTACTATLQTLGV